MELERVFDFQLTLTAKQKSMPINDVILEILRGYNGTCQGSAFILEVLSLVERSSVVNNHGVLDGSANVNGKFLAKIFHYSVGDLFLAKVENLEQTVRFSGKHINALNVIGGKLPPLKVGDYIVCCIRAVGYPLFEHTVTAQVDPYLSHPASENVWLVSGQLDDIETDSVRSILNRVKEKQDMLAKKPKKLVEFFEAKLYPFPDYVRNKSTIVDWDTLLTSSKQRALYRSPCDTRTSGVITDLGDHPDAIPDTLYNVLTRYASDWLMHLDIIIDLCNAFDGGEVQTRQTHIWSKMDSVKNTNKKDLTKVFNLI